MNSLSSRGPAAWALYVGRSADGMPRRTSTGNRDLAVVRQDLFEDHRGFPPIRVPADTQNVVNSAAHGQLQHRPVLIVALEADGRILMGQRLCVGRIHQLRGNSFAAKFGHHTVQPGEKDRRLQLKPMKNPTGMSSSVATSISTLYRPKNRRRKNCRSCVGGRSGCTGRPPPGCRPAPPRRLSHWPSEGPFSVSPYIDFIWPLL